MKKMFISLIVVLFLTGCPKKEHSQLENFRLIIGYIPHVQFTPLYVGISKGFFKEIGLNLIIEYGFGLDAFALLSTDKADIALSDSDQLIISHTKGMPLYAIYQYYQNYPTSIVTNPSYLSPEMLVNKKIGVPDLFGTSYIGLMKFLDYYGLDDNVDIIKIGYSQIPSLTSKKVDAIVCFYNNEPIQLRMKGYPLQEWKISDVADLAGASFITSNNQIINKTKQLKQFNKAMSKSIDWTKNNQQEALEIAYSAIGSLKPEDMPFHKEVLNKTLDVIYGSSTKPGKIDSITYRNTIDELFDLKLIDQKIDEKSIILAIE